MQLSVLAVQSLNHTPSWQEFDLNKAANLPNRPRVVCPGNKWEYPI